MVSPSPKGPLTPSPPALGMDLRALQPAVRQGHAGAGGPLAQPGGVPVGRPERAHGPRHETGAVRVCGPARAGRFSRVLALLTP